jgi:hypothetical protein
MLSHLSNSSVSAENLDEMEEFKLDDEAMGFCMVEMDILLSLVAVILLLWDIILRFVLLFEFKFVLLLSEKNCCSL